MPSAADPAPIAFQRVTMAGVPLLVARPRAAVPPVVSVLWFHGLGASKDVHEKELRELAEAGFLAVGVDAVGHGARRLPDLDARIAAPRAQSLRSALDLASATAAEVPSLIAALVGTGVADATRVALVGVSMGAYAVYRALVETDGLAAVVAILGSPVWPHPASPHAHVDALARVPLLSITAERDASVPPDGARALHAQLSARTGGAPQRYVELSGAEHLLSPADWATTISETHAWLRRYAA